MYTPIELVKIKKIINEFVNRWKNVAAAYETPYNTHNQYVLLGNC